MVLYICNKRLQYHECMCPHMRVQLCTHEAFMALRKTQDPKTLVLALQHVAGLAKQ